jgi:hypothetical protein
MSLMWLESLETLTGRLEDSVDGFTGVRPPLVPGPMIVHLESLRQMPRSGNGIKGGVGNPLTRQLKETAIAALLNVFSSRLVRVVVPLGLNAHNRPDCE